MMGDTIRWCLTHSKQQAIVGACEACFNEGGYMKYMAYQCEIVTMIRADQPKLNWLAIRAFLEKRQLLMTSLMIEELVDAALEGSE